MIDYLDDACKAWGAAERRIQLGGYWYDSPEGEKRFHYDGHAAKSIAGKMFSEREGAGQGGGGQHYPEVMTGDALAVRRAIRGINEFRFYLLTYWYVIPRRFMATKQKVHELGELYPTSFSNTRKVYDELHYAHVWIEARWQDVPRETELSAQIPHKMVNTSGLGSR